MPLDGTVVAGALVTAFLTALGFGLVPALRAAGQRPSAALGTSPAGSGGTRAESRGRRVLVAGQIALSLGLLASVFQLTSTLELAEPPGTDPERMLLASFDLAQLRFSSGESNAFYAALLDRASKLPGVEAAGLSSRDLRGRHSGPSQRGVSHRVLICRGPRTPNSATGLLDRREPPLHSRVCRWRIVQGRGARPPSRPRFRRGGPARHPRGGNRHRTPGLHDLRGRLHSAGACTSRQPSWRTGGRRPDCGHRGIARGDFTARMSPLSSSPRLSSPRHSRTAPRGRSTSAPEVRPAALAPAIRDIVAQIDPRVPLLELATLDEKIRSDTTVPGPPRAGGDGGRAGHRGAPARQRRPLRSDLV